MPRTVRTPARTEDYLVLARSPDLARVLTGGLHLNLFIKTCFCTDGVLVMHPGLHLSLSKRNNWYFTGFTVYPIPS